MTARLDTADGAMRRMSGIAALVAGAVAFGAGATGPAHPPALVLLMAASVALATWVLLMAVFVLGPLQGRNQKSMPHASPTIVTSVTEQAAPLRQVQAPSQVVAGAAEDPLSVTPGVAPASRVPARKRSRMPAPLIPRAADGPAGGLDAAVARSHDGKKVPSTGPERLARPRGGIADDLKSIRGIGPKLERLLNEEGIWHFDQIAAWKARDIAAVDARLGTFRGRITRDAWVKQARILAQGSVGERS